MLFIAVVALCAKADPIDFKDQWVAQGVPAHALDLALAYKNPQITNDTFLVIGDYTAPSTEQRLYLLNLKTGELAKSYMTHGEGSDDGSGTKAVRFSNIDNSLMTSPGFMRIGDPIVSHNYGPAFRLDGLEARNDLVAARMVILHAADYTSLKYIAAHDGHPGLSQGCPAMPPAMLQLLRSKNITGALFYAYTSEDADQ